MRTRLLAILLSLMALVLLALGIPLAIGQAAAQQQSLIIDRIDDTARFASLAQYVTARPAGNELGVADEDGRLQVLKSELARYQHLYGVKAGVFYRGDREPMAVSPADWRVEMEDAETRQAFEEAQDGRRSHDPPQVWPWEEDRLVVASPLVRDGDVVAVVLTDSPTEGMRSRILSDWLVLALGECAAMLLAVLAAFRLTGWVLLPVRVLDRVTHEIATGRLASRVSAGGGPPELRRLAGSFNEMADNVEQVLEQQRAFVADASHQLRNPLSALLLRIEALGMEMPQGHEDEFDGVREEGRRLARVLDDLLDLALAEHARPDPQLVDIGALAVDRADAWRVIADRERISLLCGGSTDATGWADPVAFSSALDAVVDNALKFTPQGGRVVVNVSESTYQVSVTVADEGPGLTEEELKRIGDRFWRSGRHQNVNGSGLGLSIAKALLKAGGGSMVFAANQPRGLAVTVSVPRSGPRH